MPCPGACRTSAAYLALLLAVVAAPGDATAATDRPQWIFAGLQDLGTGVPAEALERTELDLYAALRRADVARMVAQIARPEGGPVPAEAAGRLAEAARLLRRGLQSYLDMRMSASVRHLQGARDLFDAELQHMGDAAPFVRCSLYLTMSYLSDGKDDDADRVLAQLLRRYPEGDLPLSEFPPQLLARIERILEQVRGRANRRLLVDSDPSGAALWLDGNVGGRAPIAIEGLTPGDHALRLEAAGRAPLAEVLTLPEAGPPTKRSLRLEPVGVDLGAGALALASRVGGGEPALTAAARTLAKEAGVTAIVFGWLVLEDEGGLRLTAARYDAALGRFRVVATFAHAPDEAGRIAAVDHVVGALIQERPEPGSEEARAAFFSPAATEATVPIELGLRATASAGPGLGWASGVSDPGLAPVPLAVFLEVGSQIHGAFDLSLLGRLQFLEPTAALLLPRLGWRPGGPRAPLRLSVGIPFGRLRQTIVDTETEHPGDAGFTGIAFAASAEMPIAPSLALVGEALLLQLLPDQTLHADLHLGITARF